MEKNSVKLRVISSSSNGNAFALDNGDSILLIEAGVPVKDVQKAIDFRADKVVGCIVTHIHGDHAKYASEYAKYGIKIYGCGEVEKTNKFLFDQFEMILPEKNKEIMDFTVVPFLNFHDVTIYGYIIRHENMGTMLFATDTYKVGIYLSGIDHWLIEANYDDRILKANIHDGVIDRGQANRLMLSHMSINNTINYLKECHAEQSKTITLCHLSERNSDPDAFQKKVASEFGVPCFIAEKGTVVELSKEII